jgi:prepilin-type N-terminal cleavage/methylation domain-containing protein
MGNTDNVTNVGTPHTGEATVATGAPRSGMTLIETLVAVAILATALVGLGNFMAKFAHATRVSSLQQRAIDLASDRIDSVKHSSTYVSIDSMAGTQNVSADSAIYAVQTMVQLVGGGPADTLNYKIVTVSVTIPTVTTPVRKTTSIAAF